MKYIKETLVYRWFDEVWNKGNEAAIDEIFHPEGKAHGLVDNDLIGPGSFKPFFYTFRNDFSDINVVIEDVIIEGDMQVARCSVTARHNSTGKDIDFTGISISKIKDNMIIEAWNNFDFLRMTQQLTAQ